MKKSARSKVKDKKGRKKFGFYFIQRTNILNLKNIPTYIEKTAILIEKWVKKMRMYIKEN